MPIIKSAKKKLKQDKKRRQINLLFINKVKNVVKKYKKKPSKAGLDDIYRHLDMLKKKKIYHANKVNRLKSRLSKLVEKKEIKTIKTKTPKGKKTSV